MQLESTVDGVVRPKRDAVREIFDQRQMQREIAKVVWRLNLVVAAVDVKQPAIGSHRKNREAYSHCPEPKTAIAH